MTPTIRFVRRGQALRAMHERATAEYKTRPVTTFAGYRALLAAMLPEPRTKEESYLVEAVGMPVSVLSELATGIILAGDVKPRRIAVLSEVLALPVDDAMHLIQLDYESAGLVLSPAVAANLRRALESQAAEL